MRHLFAVVGLLFFACAHAPAPLPKPEPVLSRGEALPMDVYFSGFAPEADTLYVCLHVNDAGNPSMGCVPFGYFMQRYQEQMLEGAEQAAR